MWSAAKVAIPCVLGIGSVCLVASNWIFKKEETIRIQEEGDWHWQVMTLLKKVKENKPSGIVQKIEGENSDSLKLSDTSGGFDVPENAKNALQAWCQKNDDPDKELLEELCNRKQKRNWLFR